MVERLELGAAVRGGGVVREAVASLPVPLHQGALAACVLGRSLHLVTEGAMWSLDTDTGQWRELPPPLGSLGVGRPVLASLPPLLCLVGARPGEGQGATNCLQLYDTISTSWRRQAPLATRLTPLDLVTHCGQAFLLGWQPARHNFILALTPQGEGVVQEVLVEGVEGVWTRGCLVRRGCLLGA